MMKINETSLIRLRDLLLNETQFSTGPTVMTFFNRFGYNENYFTKSFYDTHGNKWEYALSMLRELNNQSKINLVLFEVFHPINFIDHYQELDRLIIDFNRLLRYDDCMLVRRNDNVIIVNLYRTLKQFNSFVDKPQIIIGLLPKIEKILVLDDYKIHIYLADSYDFIFDFVPCLEYSCNNELKGINLFKQVKFKSRMMYWNDNYDIHLDQMIPDEYRQHIN